MINENILKQNSFKNENININNTDNENYVVDSIIKNSLEYYDNYQQKIQNILNNLEYVKIINNQNINDEYIFYDSNDNIILKSRIETLSIFTPQNNTWKWSWSVPFAKYKNTLISRKILEYAFTLNSDSDFLLKSTLINSKIIISNQYQLDIYLALAANLSKNPFIFRIYLYPFFENINDDTQNTNNAKSKLTNNTENIYYYRKILNHPDKKKFISIFSFLIDYKF